MPLRTIVVVIMTYRGISRACTNFQPLPPVPRAFINWPRRVNLTSRLAPCGGSAARFGRSVEPLWWSCPPPLCLAADSSPIEPIAPRLRKISHCRNSTSPNRTAELLAPAVPAGRRACAGNVRVGSACDRCCVQGSTHNGASDLAARLISLSQIVTMVPLRTSAEHYFNLAYSALAAMRIGMSGSASFHNDRSFSRTCAALSFSPRAR
jgi:hypothetical protein